VQGQKVNVSPGPLEVDLRSREEEPAGPTDRSDWLTGGNWAVDFKKTIEISKFRRNIDINEELTAEGSENEPLRGNLSPSKCEFCE